MPTWKVEEFIMQTYCGKKMDVLLAAFCVLQKLVSVLMVQCRLHVYVTIGNNDDNFIHINNSVCSQYWLDLGPIYV